MNPVLELLKELISRPSLTPNDAGCQQWIAKRLTACGFQVESHRFGEVDNLWATHGEGGKLICLAGHTDVVPPGPLADWTSPPFEPTLRDGYLYGRGAADMKASDSAMVIALEQLAIEGHPGRIALLLTSDEEGSGIDGTRKTLAHLIREGVAIDGAIVGEPTSETIFGDVIKNGRRGAITGIIRVEGVQGHTAYPHLADNAIHRIAPVMAQLIKLDWGGPEEHFPATSLQICNLHAGTGVNNVIPGTCELQFNIRHGASLSAEVIQGRVNELFRQQGIKEEIEWQVSAFPFLTESGILLKSLKSAVERVTGETPRTSTAGGTSDARFFFAHGIPVVEFGPLNSSIHAANEQVELRCLEPLAQIYKEACRAFLSAGSQSSLA